MHIQPRHRALGALACLFTAAFMASPMAAAQTSPGKVLFWRTMSGTVDGFKTATGSVVFSIDDDGFNERQLTPYKEGVFNMPGVLPYESVWTINAFSPSGRYSLLLKAHTALPHYPGQSYQGKYWIVDAGGNLIRRLFPGSDDLQNPSEGPGRGAVTWGPAGTNEIAYANSPDDYPHKHPACIRLIHPDGTGDHKLWCASRWDYRGIEAIRWSGDGRKLLAYAVRSAGGEFPDAVADVFLVDSATGAGTLVQATVRAPYNGDGVGDISYDGHEVLYSVVYDTHADGPCNVPSEGPATLWCAKNMLTGETVALTDPSNVVRFFSNLGLLSPDGSEAYVPGTTTPAGATNTVSELYALRTGDGSGLRRITDPCLAMDENTSMWWTPVRVSPDGGSMLANCHAEHYPPAPVVLTNKIMIVNLTDGSMRFVTNGHAYDWHTP